jgi:NADPH:quinone reductase-like Zn-dependent oxidoreductase
MGATTVGTARTQDKLERCKALGLDVGVVPADGKFADRVPAPAVVIELVGGNYLAEDLRCVQPLGRIVLVGLLAGRKQELDLGSVLGKRVRIFGTVLRARPLEEKIAATRAFETQVVPLLARGAIKPIVDRVVPLADAAAAHEHMASNQGFGKIVLAV